MASCSDNILTQYAFYDIFVNVSFSARKLFNTLSLRKTGYFTLTYLLGISAECASLFISVITCDYY